MKTKKDIKYIGRDFSSFREELIEFAKNYFPDTYTDFTAASPGMMFIEMAAYVGDVLSFYQDTQIQETFLEYAKNPVSLYAMAYMMGYRPKITTVSEVELSVSQEVDAKFVDGSTYEPDWEQAYVLGEGSVVISNTSPEISFITKDTVDFSYSSSLDPVEIEANFTYGSSVPTSFTLTKKVKAFSGEIKQFSKYFDTYKKYQTVTIEDSKIVGILSATDDSSSDTENSEWVEVPFLGQDTVFVEQSIPESGSEAQSLLKLKKVPKRFVTRFNKDGNLDIQFGAGICASEKTESDYLPNPLDIGSSVQEFSSDKFDTAYDPSNYLFSTSYGLCPVGTTITFKYIVGGGTSSNVPANTITIPGKLNLRRKNSSKPVDSSKISFRNEYAASGGRDGDTLEEIRQNSLRSFAEQKRMVTLKDFNVRALSLPSRFGSVAKAFATNGISRKVGDIDKSSTIVDLYVLSYDRDGNLTQMSDTVKENLKNYLSEYLMLTDNLNIRDAYVVNIGIKYDIVMKPGYNNMDTLKLCGDIIKKFFSVDNREINEAINLTELYNTLNEVKGVQVVKNIEVYNRYGEDKGYSKYMYNLDAAQRNDTIYPSYDPCIFELKYPDVDIEGRVVTL